jgi:hypothetical protein
MTVESGDIDRIVESVKLVIIYGCDKDVIDPRYSILDDVQKQALRITLCDNLLKYTIEYDNIRKRLRENYKYKIERAADKSL